jgi:formylglycine-generating enzyme required for sulfatase activity
MTRDPVQTENKESSGRVFHGGSWFNSAGIINVSDRPDGGPIGGNPYRGFRLARNTKEKV